MKMGVAKCVPVLHFIVLRWFVFTYTAMPSSIVTTARPCSRWLVFTLTALIHCTAVYIIIVLYCSVYSATLQYSVSRVIKEECMMRNRWHGTLISKIFSLSLFSSLNIFPFFFVPPYSYCYTWESLTKWYLLFFFTLPPASCHKPLVSVDVVFLLPITKM